MLSPDSERWVKSTANDLNNLLQVIADSSEQLASSVQITLGAERYLAMLRESVARATSVTRQLAEKVGGLAGEPPSDQAHADPSSVAILSKAPIAAPVPPASITIHNPTGNRELILIVDDEEFVTMLASRVLAGEGYRVVTAKDGFQALDFYKRLQSEISLVILDFTMPVMDGADVFAELQLLNPEVAVVLSSGFAEQDKLRAMLARGLKGFIPKPYTNQKLLDQVRQTLAAMKR